MTCVARALGCLVVFSLGLTACEGRGPENPIETTSSALGISGMPRGLMCGVAYRNNSSVVVNGYCGNPPQFTLSLQPLDGWGVSGTGDWGLNPGKGFYNQYFLTTTAGIDNTNSNRLSLPKGSVCGLTHTCTNFGTDCMGHDAAKADCPPGWDPKAGSDARAPNGCNWFWCEYRDDFNVCPNGSCSSLPGLTCGLTDNDRNNGRCLGGPTTSGCPSTAYTRHGYYDDGRSGGHGIGWCFRGTDQ
jgi:hypothetical protein